MYVPICRDPGNIFREDMFHTFYLQKQYENIHRISAESKNHLQMWSSSYYPENAALQRNMVSVSRLTL